MIIYNVTINIDTDIKSSWLDWMQKEHIPQMLATGKFTKALLTKVLVDEEMGGESFSVQYTAKSRDHLDQYYAQDAETLRSQSKAYEGKFVAFRTELQIISEH